MKYIPFSLLLAPSSGSAIAAVEGRHQWHIHLVRRGHKLVGKPPHPLGRNKVIAVQCNLQELRSLAAQEVAVQINTDSGIRLLTMSKRLS